MNKRAPSNNLPQTLTTEEKFFCEYKQCEGLSRCCWVGEVAAEDHRQMFQNSNKQLSTVVHVCKSSSKQVEIWAAGYSTSLTYWAPHTWKTLSHNTRWKAPAKSHLKLLSCLHMHLYTYYTHTYTCTQCSWTHILHTSCIHIKRHKHDK